MIIICSFMSAFVGFSDKWASEQLHNTFDGMFDNVLTS